MLTRFISRNRLAQRSYDEFLQGDTGVHRGQLELFVKLRINIPEQERLFHELTIAMISSGVNLSLVIR